MVWNPGCLFLTLPTYDQLRHLFVTELLSLAIHLITCMSAFLHESPKNSSPLQTYFLSFWPQVITNSKFPVERPH